jgi:transmembrane sensor
MKKQYFLTLLSKKLSEGISPEEETELQQAIEQDESYRLMADELTAYFERRELQLTERQVSVSNAQLKNVWQNIALAGQQGYETKYDHNEPVKNRFSKLFLLKIAAAVIVMLSCGILMFNFLNQEQGLKFSTLTTSDEKVFKTLDDGTKICLNRGSSIRYNDDFGKKKREIFLEGEAFFDVTKNKEVPLFIHAGSINIEVKGTAFNVSAYQKNARIEVSLLRGLIAVRSNADKVNEVLLKPNEKLVALAGTWLGSKAFNVIHIPADQQLQEIKWTQDSLVFKKEKLQDLVFRLEKKYNIRIEIRKEELKHKRFSGSFAAEDLKQALDALKLSYPFTYTINNKLVIIK